MQQLTRNDEGNGWHCLSLMLTWLLSTYSCNYSILKAETSKIKLGGERHNIWRFSLPHFWHRICHSKDLQHATWEPDGNADVFIYLFIYYIATTSVFTWNEHGDGWQLSLPCAMICSNRYPLDAHSVSPDQRISIYLSLSLSLSLFLSFSLSLAFSSHLTALSMRQNAEDHRKKIECQNWAWDRLMAS